jgi:ATP-dependent RNA helicase DDX24/MAK5
MKGSGKTLAYGLPILHFLLSQPQSGSTNIKRRDLKALILTPTRELALQVSAHLKECLNPVMEPLPNDERDMLSASQREKGGKQRAKKDRQHSDKRSLSHEPPPVSIAAIVGGMSSQKQQRILGRGVDVLVATPGRLWDILEEVS